MKAVGMKNKEKIVLALSRGILNEPCNNSGSIYAIPECVTRVYMLNNPHNGYLSYSVSLSEIEGLDKDSSKVAN